MDIITVRIYKSKAMYFGSHITDIYGSRWEFQPDVKNRQIKARPSVKTGLELNAGNTIGLAAVINKIGIDYLFNGRTAVTQLMTMGNDGWFTTNIEHPRTKAQRKIDVKRNAVSGKLAKEVDKQEQRRTVRADREISIRIKHGKICIPPELCGKVKEIYVREVIDNRQCVIMLSTTKISTEYRKRMATAGGVICLGDVKSLRDHFNESVLRVHAEYDRGVYTAVIDLGDKIETNSAGKGVVIEHQPVSEVEKMTFWQRVKFVFGW